MVIEMGKIKDEIGNRYGSLLVVAKSDKKSDNPNNRGTYWNCQCDCGSMVVVKGTALRSGNTKSCGHCSRQHHEDLIGQVFGSLTVLEYAGTDKWGKAKWKCKCECGNTHEVTTNLLRTGKTTSCGCRKGGREDLTGQSFGKLRIERYSHTENKKAFWFCKCSCGGSIVVDTQSLKRGNTSSCGCLVSKGEDMVRNILNEKGVSYITQKTFSDLKDKGLLRFDFAIQDLDKIWLIEFDGYQHFNSGGGWNTDQHLEDTKRKDKIKNDYCEQHSIPLLRIPFYKTYNEIKQMIDNFLKEEN